MLKKTARFVEGSIPYGDNYVNNGVNEGTVLVMFFIMVLMRMVMMMGSHVAVRNMDKALLPRQRATRSELRQRERCRSRRARRP